MQQVRELKQIGDKQIKDDELKDVEVPVLGWRQVPDRIFVAVWDFDAPNSYWLYNKLIPLSMHKALHTIKTLEEQVMYILNTNKSALTSQQIAMALGKPYITVHQTLVNLKRKRLVKRKWKEKGKGGGWLWYIP